ncbi:MAG: hypothetical protein JNM94_02565 [Phycisphaerae bacterium]|nr:hypothetical protein [Phycisphaerae bacterium]
MDPALYEEGQRALAEIRAQADAVREAFATELVSVNAKTEVPIRELVDGLAAFSDIPADIAVIRIKSALYTKSLLTFPPDTGYGDFNRPVELRQFLQFASALDPSVKAWLASRDAHAATRAELESLFDEYDLGLVTAMESRLARRGAAKPRPISPAAAWSEYYNISRPYVDRLVALMMRTDPDLGARMTGHYRSYLAPKLMGDWRADELAAAIIDEKRVTPLPDDAIKAIDEAIAAYRLERTRRANEAFELGLAACRKHGSLTTDTREQDEYAEAEARVRACSNDCLRTLERILQAITEPASWAALPGKVRTRSAERGIEPFVRDDVLRAGAPAN